MEDLLLGVDGGSELPPATSHYQYPEPDMGARFAWEGQRSAAQQSLQAGPLTPSCLLHRPLTPVIGEGSGSACGIGGSTLAILQHQDVLIGQKRQARHGNFDAEFFHNGTANIVGSASHESEIGLESTIMSASERGQKTAGEYDFLDEFPSDRYDLRV